MRNLTRSARTDTPALTSAHACLLRDAVQLAADTRWHTRPPADRGYLSGWLG